MNLADLRANGGFRQSSLSIFGNPSGVDSDKTGTARMSGEYLLEQMRRAPQPPKMRKNFGVRHDLWRKTDSSREKRQVHLKQFVLFFVFDAEVFEGKLCGQPTP